MTDAIILAGDWYQSLVEDCKAIVTERLYRSRQEVIEGWHEVGERIATDAEYQKHARGNGKTKERLAKDIGASVQSLYYAIQFYKKFPTLESLATLPEGKNLSWHKITSRYLPAPTGDDKGELPKCICPHCGNEHRKVKP